MTENELRKQWCENHKPKVFLHKDTSYEPATMPIPIPTNYLSNGIPYSKHLVFDYDITKRDYGE